MKLLQDFYAEYPVAVATMGRVPPVTDLPSLVAIRHLLPAFFLNRIAESGRAMGDYHCYGSYCEHDRSFAKVPWVTCRERRIALDARDGFHLTLLIREDMAGCWLSLNRGSLLHRQGVSPDAALASTQDACSRVLQLMEPPAGFVVGPIDLAASTPRGRHFEAGAAISRFYPAVLEISDAEFAADIHTLLECYHRIPD